MSKTLKALSKAVKQFEDDGAYILLAEVQEYTEDDVLYYTGVIVIDGP